MKAAQRLLVRAAIAVSMIVWCASPAAAGTFSVRCWNTNGTVASPDTITLTVVNSMGNVETGGPSPTNTGVFTDFAVTSSATNRDLTLTFRIVRGNTVVNLTGIFANGVAGKQMIDVIVPPSQQASQPNTLRVEPPPPFREERAIPRAVEAPQTVVDCGGPTGCRRRLFRRCRCR